MSLLRISVVRCLCTNWPWCSSAFLTDTLPLTHTASWGFFIFWYYSQTRFQWIALGPDYEHPPTHTHTHTRLTALFPGLPAWAGTRKVKPIWILLEQETVGGSGISWAMCKFAPRFRRITTPAPHHSVFYRPDALPATQPTASKHWRHSIHPLRQNIHLSMFYIVLCV